MASGTYYPATSGDDGVRQGATSFYLTWVDGHIGDTGGVPNKIFIRFPNVTIPSGVTITAAFVRFTSRSTTADATCSEELSFNDVDNAVAPTTYGEFDALVKTSATVAWTVGAWTNDAQHDSDDITTPLQEIIDRVGWSSGNAVTLIGDGTASDTNADRIFDQYDEAGGANKAELHVTWATVYTGEISEDVNVTSEFEDNFGELNEDVNVNSEFACLVADVLISENVSVNSEIIYFETDSPISEDTSVNSELIAEYTGELSEEASVNSGIVVTHQQSGELLEGASVNSTIEVARHLTISETLSSWDTLKWGWRKSITDSMAITETVEKILGIPVKDWLTLTDTEIANWNGTEAVSDSFYAVDISKVIKVYADLIADGMAVTDAVNIALELIITDILTCTDTMTSIWAGIRSIEETFSVSDAVAAIKLYYDLVADGMAVTDAVNLALELIIADKLKVVDSAQDIGTFQHPVEDSMTLADVVKRAFPKSVSDSLAVADTSLIDFLALLQIADSINITEAITPKLTISQIIADALETLDTVAIQQLLQELVQDGLNIEVIVELDDELWQCWVLSTGAFHPSIYSGYDYNSFALFNDVAYGAKSDGIYELEGSTDNGTAFHSGIILPATNFASSKNMRFRKAYFGVSGNNLVMKLDTDSGSRTFRMVDTEMSLTRDLKGRKWQISLEDFDELDFAELIPVILSRK